MQPQEGIDLVDVYHGRREVVGLAPGTGRRADEWDVHRAADAGWAASEVRRLRETADTAAWIVSSELDSPAAAVGVLLVALKQCGARITWARVNDGAALYRVHFAPRDSVGSSLSQ